MPAARLQGRAPARTLHDARLWTIRLSVVACIERGARQELKDQGSCGGITRVEQLAQSRIQNGSIVI